MKARDGNKPGYRHQRDGFVKTFGLVPTVFVLAVVVLLLWQPITAAPADGESVRAVKTAAVASQAIAMTAVGMPATPPPLAIRHLSPTAVGEPRAAQRPKKDAAPEVTDDASRGGLCQTDADCDDGNPCTDDRCSPLSGTCVHPCSPAGQVCDDGNECTVFDACDGACNCVGADVNTFPCGIDADCPVGTCDQAAGLCVCDVKCIPPGEDCFTTVCDGGTFIDFGAGPVPPIPADYFFPGSPPFIGPVLLGGAGGFPGDTLIRRLDTVCFDCPLPQTRFIPTEMVQLDLVSCSCITVGFPPEDQLFEARVSLGAGPSPGDMTVTKDRPDGGVFTSNLNVNAQIEFFPCGSPPGTPAVGLAIPTPVSFGTSGVASWQQDDPGISFCSSVGFYAGFGINPSSGLPCCYSTCHGNPGGSHPHCVIPPKCPECPRCDPADPLACDDGDDCTIDKCDPVSGVCSHGAILCESDLDCPAVATCDTVAGICICEPCPGTDPKACEGKGTICGDPTQDCICETRPDGTLNCADARDYFDPTRHGICPNGSDSECEDQTIGTKCFLNTPDGIPVCAHNCGKHVEPDPHITLQGTSATFGSLDVPEIPADFFFPGSSPFNGPVNLVGGPNDTLGQRDGPIECPGAGFPRPCDPVGVELIELSLVSAAPITVGPTQWDVEVDLSPSGNPPLGTLTATITHPNGGTYNAGIPFSPRFTFTEVGNPGNVRVLDYAVEDNPPIEINFLGTDWVLNVNPALGILAPNTGNFVPGVRENVQGDPNSQKVIQALGLSKGEGIDHPVSQPPDPKACQGKGLPCGGPDDDCICETRPDGRTQCAEAADLLPPCRHGVCQVDDDCLETGTKCFVQPGALGCCAHNCGEEPPPVLEACCFDDGSCLNLPAGDCVGADGAPRGPGTACLGDADLNGIDDACEFSTKCDDCGPGPHWIDFCPAGHDRLPSGAVLGIDTTGNCQVDLNLVMFGPAEVARGAGSPHSIPTEMVAMKLTGGGAVLRAGAGGGVGPGAPLGASLGSIVELGDTVTGASSFGILFELDLGAGLFAYNQAPLTISANILCVSPNRIYEHLDGCIPLFDSPTPGPGDIPVANLVTANHDPFGDPKTCAGKGDQCGDGTQECVCETRPDNTLNCADAVDFFTGRHGFCPSLSDTECEAQALGTKCFLNSNPPVCAHNCGKHVEPDPHITQQGTSATFNTPDVEPIPADFFGPGSDPFNGTVNLTGGPNDTLGQRDGPIECPGAGFPRPCDPVGVELVELSLVSVSPIFVGGGGPPLWDVEVDLSPTGTPPLGTLTATLTHANGGTYDAGIPFSPRFTFTEVGNPGNVRVLDYGLALTPPIEINFLGTDWVVNVNPALGILAPNTGNFVPGVRENIQGDPNSQKVIQALGESKGGGIDHPITQPPDPKGCQGKGLPCGDPGDDCICETRPDGRTQCAEAADLVPPCLHGACQVDADCLETGTKCFVQPGALGCCAHNCGDEPSPTGSCCLDSDGDGHHDTCLDNITLTICLALDPFAWFSQGGICSGIIGSCCLDWDGDGHSDLCTDGVDQDCCLLEGGSFTAGGTCSGVISGCCLDWDGDGHTDLCLNIDQTCCLDQGGTVLPAPCAGITGACCLDSDGDGHFDICTDGVDQQCCLLEGGAFNAGGICSGNIGSCCLDWDGDGHLDTCTNGVDRDCCTLEGGLFTPGAICSGIISGCCVDWDLDGHVDTCLNIDRDCCVGQGGLVKPTLCSEVIGACCLDDDGNGLHDDICVVMDEDCCDSQDGWFLGAGTVCLGDLDGNGTDDACEMCLKPAPPGKDSWATACDGSTSYDFSLTPIPADFFEPGSAPFTDVVAFGGATGGLDTVVLRKDAMCFDGPLPVTAVTGVRLQQLDLVSCEKILVDVQGTTPQEWRIIIRLAGPQDQGTLTAIKVDDNGGTYTATIPVNAEFLFIRNSDGETRGPIPAGNISLSTSVPAPWAQTNCPTGFCPGQTTDPGGGICCKPTCHDNRPASGHKHCTQPQDCPACPECTWDNGPPLDDFGEPASQYDDFPPNVFSAETADDFFFTGKGKNPCLLNGVRFWATYFNVPPGVVPNPPAQWTGVTISIYENADPKGPAGNRRDDGSFTPGLVATRTVPMAFVGVIPFSLPCLGATFQIDVTLPNGIALVKNHKYWIVFQPNMDFGDNPAGGPGFGQVGILLSEEIHEHPAQQIFPLAGLPVWVVIPGNEGVTGAASCNNLPAGSRRDLAFELFATKSRIEPPILAIEPDIGTPIRKNRYISIDPRGAGGTNVGQNFGISVTLTSTLVNGVVAVGSTWWANPHDANCISIVGPSKPVIAPNWDACPTLHLTGCPIIPTATYDIEAVGANQLLAAETQLKPADNKWWGDAVGFFTGAFWTGPQGVTSFDDVTACLKTFQNPNAINATHTSVTDVHPNQPPLVPPFNQINKIVNIDDVFQFIKAFQGFQYPGPEIQLCTDP